MRPAERKGRGSFPSGRLNPRESRYASSNRKPPETKANRSKAMAVTERYLFEEAGAEFHPENTIKQIDINNSRTAKNTDLATG
jgi:hypothetical protein